MYELISLNIQGNKILQFCIDGPALRLRRQGEATRWFPLRRIRQICITGDLATGTETLIKLAEKRIPVTLFSATGKLLCQMIHPDAAPAELTQLLDEASHDVALQQAYEHWYENTRLQAYAYVGASRGCVKLAHEVYTQELGEVLNHYQLKETHQQATSWMHGISQTGISRVLDEKGIDLHGQHRSRLQHQLSKISWPIEQQAAYRWLIRNHHQPVTPRNLHHALGQLEQELIPWFARCLHQLQSALEQASYTATADQKKRWYGS